MWISEIILTLLFVDYGSSPYTDFFNEYNNFVYTEGDKGWRSCPNIPLHVNYHSSYLLCPKHFGQNHSC